MLGVSTADRPSSTSPTIPTSTYQTATEGSAVLAVVGRTGCSTTSAATVTAQYPSSTDLAGHGRHVLDGQVLGVDLCRRRGVEVQGLERRRAVVVSGGEPGGHGQLRHARDRAGTSASPPVDGVAGAPAASARATEDPTQPPSPERDERPQAERVAAWRGRAGRRRVVVS